MPRPVVDTGASTTCISASVAGALGLEPTGKVPMQTAGGSIDTNVYDVRMAFLLGTIPDKSGKPVGTGELIDRVIQAPEFDPGGNDYKALIGRDVLQMGVLTLSFDGHYSFSY